MKKKHISETFTEPSSSPLFHVSSNQYRRMFVPNAIKYFLNQDYPNKELIIIDDGTIK